MWVVAWVCWCVGTDNLVARTSSMTSSTQISIWSMKLHVDISNFLAGRNIEFLNIFFESFSFKWLQNDGKWFWNHVEGIKNILQTQNYTSVKKIRAIRHVEVKISQEKCKKLKSRLKNCSRDTFWILPKVAFWLVSSKAFASNGRRMMGNQFRNIFWVWKTLLWVRAIRQWKNSGSYDA